MASWASIAATRPPVVTLPASSSPLPASAGDDISSDEKNGHTNNTDTEVETQEVTTQPQPIKTNTIISSTSSPRPMAVDFASIMVEQSVVSKEEKRQIELQQRQEFLRNNEEAEILLAIQESLQQQELHDSTRTTNNNDDGGATVEDLELLRAIELSKAMMDVEGTTGAATNPSCTNFVANNDEKNDEDRKIPSKISNDVEDKKLSPTILNKDGASESEIKESVTSPVASAAAIAKAPEPAMSAEELEQIEKALREADDAETARTIQLAIKLQNEEDDARRGYQQRNGNRHKQPQGHVRLLTQNEFLYAKGIATNNDQDEEYDYEDDYDDDYNDHDGNIGYRCNAQQSSYLRNNGNNNQNRPNNNSWSRIDKNTIIGPNYETRTKHDPSLIKEANAHRLGLTNDSSSSSKIGNRAYNSFQQAMKSTKKGVSMHGTGNATKNTNKTREGGMDNFAMAHIRKAINAGLIERCNGVIKEGKEALIYHAKKGDMKKDNHNKKQGEDHDNEDGNNDSNKEIDVVTSGGTTSTLQIKDVVDNNDKLGNSVDRDKEEEEEQEEEQQNYNINNSNKKISSVNNDKNVNATATTEEEQRYDNGGYDVAIKVFKRISEFRNRSEYIMGDPRYHKVKKSFGSTKKGWNDSRKELEMWAEKEYRNLIRANRAGVAVPTPIFCKENVLFMRFLGQNGWPCPQLRDLSTGGGIKRGSSKWRTLYDQTLLYIGKLYNKARLVHGDLSEYNILVCPSSILENNILEVQEEGKKGEEEDILQVVFIDFGQAVDIRHPNAMELLRRDLRHVKQFFDNMGIRTMDIKTTEDMVLKSS